MVEKFTRMNERVYDYLLAHQAPEHHVLAKLRSVTEKLPEAKMLATTEQAQLLFLLVRLIQARRILEIGTFTGASTLVMALALPDAGRVTTCDLNNVWTSIGSRYWKLAGVADKIDLRVGDALSTLGSIEATSGPDQFDLTFIDADKTGYDAYYESCLRLARPGGLLVIDNTLRRGRVVDPGDTEPETEALRAINVKIANDERVDRVLLPIASGMTLVRRR